jgi:predicted ATPase/class 3 adenylate cyclase
MGILGRAIAAEIALGLASVPDPAASYHTGSCSGHSVTRERRGADIVTDLPSGTVTFLFTDIEGSTALWERERQAMAAAVDRHIALLDAAIQAHGGVHFKTVGDAVQAAFPTAPAAVAAALDAQRALLAEDWGAIGPLWVRMAVHAGEAEPDAGGDYLSAPLNRLSRLLATGHGGQILLTQAVQQLTRGALPPSAALHDLGEHRLRDLLEPERVFQLVHPDLAVDFPDLTSLDARPHNLPLQPTPFLGREREVGEIVDRLGRPDVRLLTLTGPGGTGKTRLALQAAAEVLDDFADGVFFVPLAPLADPALVPSAIANALGIREVAEQSVADQLRDVLAPQQVLLVLDNVEHLIAAAPGISALLAAAPGLKVLATSRLPLRLRAEREYPVPPLSLPRRKPPPPAEQLSQFEAVRLFIDRAQAVKPDFTVDNENAPAVAEICWRLDGLPLAIELAAARIRLLPPQAMLARLEQRLPFLTGGALDAPQRQQTLRDTIAWSYDLLTPEEQQLFRQLSVFAGGITIEAAEAITSRSRSVDVLGGLERLVAQSLVRQESGAHGEPRFLLLETIREYGGEQLVASGEDDAARRSHASYFLEVAERSELTGANAQIWLERCETEHDNFRGALAWLIGADTEMALRLARRLSDFWLTRGHFAEGRTWLESALATSEHASPRTRMAGLNALASIAGPQGDYERAATAAEEALGYARDLGETEHAAWAVMMLGALAWIRGDISRAVALNEEALGLRRTLGHKAGTATVLNNLSLAAMAQTDYGRAGTYLEEALELTQDADDEEIMAKTLELMGWLALQQDQHSRAARLLRESLVLSNKLGDRWQVAACVRAFAEVARGITQPQRSARLHGAAEAIRQDVGGALEPTEREEDQQSYAAIRDAIGEAAFTASWAAGKALPLEAAVTEAMTLTDELDATASPSPEAI